MPSDRGKCPKCDARLMSVNVEHVNVVGAGKTYKGISYVCPHCASVLSVAIDPLAISGDAVAQILGALGKG
jgi:hypothetical protein